MQRTLWLILVLLIAGTSNLNAADYDAFELTDEVGRLRETEYWPGFNPGGIPIAVFDGEQTLLFKHPKPPEGFTPLEDRKGVYSFAGQHPQVKGNTAIEIGGVACGTFLLDMFKDRSLSEAAGVVVHECFHVWQKDHFPDRWPNAADLFTYPRDDVRLLTLRRQESEALRRSLAEEDRSVGETWLAARPVAESGADGTAQPEIERVGTRCGVDRGYGQVRGVGRRRLSGAGFAKGRLSGGASADAAVHRWPRLGYLARQAIAGLEKGSEGDQAAVARRVALDKLERPVGDGAVHGGRARSDDSDRRKGRAGSEEGEEDRTDQVPGPRRLDAGHRVRGGCTTLAARF